ncbi:adenine phosphoribosyltransferase [Sulfurimonas sp.]|jgi:adenine phosphoribosyltransferase|uniref:adenine phosphoribosyltransferase n=1 Tax=Sulfurimonas sp. TaxID=2022749 RepID=UPI0025DAC0E8|nr:adenine phosphoribosyltransferase [Sulfurimonas sp.]MBT5934029.1 adenine phosphoribosyltransferase [Sulfurimonas sp.]
MILSNAEQKIIEDSIRDIKDFPKEGIVFKDITTLLNNKEAYGVLMNHLYQRYKGYNLDYVAGIDARGFIFGAALAQMLGLGFVPIRKKGKLPYTTISEKYALEYGVDEIEVHIDAFGENKGARVLIIDDLIATGGTANAAATLVKQAGATCVECCFVIGLAFLDGIKKLQEKTDVYCLIEEN